MAHPNSFLVVFSLFNYFCYEGKNAKMAQVSTLAPSLFSQGCIDVFTCRNTIQDRPSLPALTYHF